MNKRIAIPLENGVLCAHFGHCEEFAIVDVENNLITGISKVIPPEHVPGLYPKWVAQLGVTDVIVGGMGQKAVDLFNEQNINAFIGAPVDKPEVLVKDFIDGKLEVRGEVCNHDGHHHQH
jgi:predicted Fe-Mo cluster-binding NifX family protein